MPQKIQIRLNPKEASLDHVISVECARALGASPNEIGRCLIRSRSIDARQKIIKINLAIDVYFKDETVPAIRDEDRFLLTEVGTAREVIVLGSGPAGLFAALTLIERGLKPVIIERGKAVDDRKRDVAALNSKGVLDPNSNWCRGEGGAGTFTDGKLYTRSTKRGNVRKILNTFVEFGADPDILVNAHPHIGTDKLPAIVAKMRERIKECGGVFRFETRLTGITTRGGALDSVELNDSERIKCDTMIAASGHSAEDVYRIFNSEGIKLIAKPFAVGVRLEHPQAIIDKIRYKSEKRDDYLPPAEYSYTEQTDNGGVYSFCMCPGGIIVPSMTEPGELVLNGMSNSTRNGATANAGFVAEVRPENIPGTDENPLAGLDFRRKIEMKCLQKGSGFSAPAQRLNDFLSGKISKDLPETSYYPGTVSADLREFFPKFITESLKTALRSIGKKVPEFVTNSAMLLAPETRTSSPVCIERNRETHESTACKGLYPCGEGSGYAGGITSSAVDGMNAALQAAIALGK